MIVLFLRRFMKILLVIVSILSISISIVFAQSTETLSITTYYPSPYGVYKELRLFPSSPSPCTVDNEGSMYFDQNAHLPMVCRRMGNGNYEWDYLLSGGVYVNPGFICSGTDTPKAYKTIAVTCDGAGPNFCTGGTTCTTGSHGWSLTGNFIETCPYDLAKGDSQQKYKVLYPDPNHPGAYIYVYWDENICQPLQLNYTCKALPYVLCEPG
jgi:hypothetical protein